MHVARSFSLLALVAIMCVRVFSTSAYAAPESRCLFSGQNFAKWMKAQERIDANNANEADYMEASFYLGYIAGFSDTILQLAHIESEIPGFTKAILDNLPRSPLGDKKNVTLGQLNAIVNKYLKNNPEEWSNCGSFILLKALIPTPAQ